MIIFGGQSHPAFTKSLANRLGVEVSVPRTSRFDRWFSFVDGKYDPGGLQ